MKKKAADVQVCLNPKCRKSYSPGHYGKRQKVCSTGTFLEKCSKKCPGKTCKKCFGKGSYKSTCKAWYRKYWSQVRKPPRGLPEADQRRCFEAVQKVDVRFWSLLVAAAYSALRKGELLGITWGDVDDGDGGIRSNFPLLGQWDDRDGFRQTKTGNQRVAFFVAEVRAAVLKLRTTLAKNEVATDRVWPFTEIHTWKRWTTLQRRLKISNPETRQPYRFHDLRHTAALRALKKTKDLSAAATLCGHKNLATTAIYTQQRPEDFIKTLER